VSGGLGSGKSTYARRRAAEMGPPPWLYVAPEVEGDAVLKDRLAKYRRDQEAIWRVKDAPVSLLDVLTPDVLDDHGAVMIDRFSVWIAGQLRTRAPAQDAELQDEIERLADKLYHSRVPVVLVTTEVGLGFLPAAVADRRLIDVVGLANQTLAARADGVVFMVSGVPLRLR